MSEQSAGLDPVELTLNLYDAAKRLFEFRGDRMSHARAFLDRGEALKAVGLED
jgi:hypothetical protein